MFKQILPALLLAGLSAVAVAALSDQDPATESVAVIFAPGTGLARGIERVAAAGGTAVGTGAFDNVILATPDREDFADRARTEGAVLVLAARGLGGCLGTSAGNRRQTDANT